MKKKKIFAIVSVSLASLLFIAFLTGFLVIYYYSNEEASSSCVEEEFEENMCGINNAEDIVRIGDSNWVLSSNMGDQNWENGGFYAIDIETKEAVELIPDFDNDPLPGYQELENPSLFSSHGISIRAEEKDHTFTVYAVNHGSVSSIEAFTLEVTDDKPTMNWIGSIPFPNNETGNAVAALPTGGFVTTVPMVEEDLGTMVDFISGDATGVVYKWTLEEEWSEVPESNFAGNNGIVVSPDGEWIYLNAYTSKELHKIPVNDLDQPQSSVNFSFLPDNVRMSANGTLLVTGHDASPLTIVGLCNSTSIDVCPVKTVVSEVDPETMEQRIIFERSSTQDFGGGTSAIIVEDELWVSSFKSQRIITTKLEETEY